MNIIKAENLACPIDGERLAVRDKQLACANGHTFDIARQGYVHLLPVQHKRTKQPGDSKEMVAARTQFLNSGVYEPVARRLAEITLAQITSPEGACIMDAGCGEGYYVDHVYNALRETDGPGALSFIGLDISRPAIAAAAPRSRQVTWVVGTNRLPPVEAASVDIILCVFGFHSYEGFQKILKPGGKVILVEPGPDHLQELREIIYTEVKKTAPPDLAHAEKSGFSLINSESLRFKTGPVDNTRIHNLLLMTPHFYRATREGRDAAARVQVLDLTVDVLFRVLQLRGK